MHSYKAGNQSAKEMSDDDAVAYCEQFNIPMPHVGGIEADAALSPSAAIAEQLQAPIPAPAEEPAAAAKTPKPKASRKRKSEAAEPAQPTPAAAAAAAATPTDKKRKRASAKPVEQPEKDEPKKSGRKKAKSG